MRQSFCFALLFILSLGVANAAPTAEDLQQLQSKLKQEQLTQTQMQQRARSVAQEVSHVRKQMVKAALDVQNNEEVLTELERNLADLEEKKKQVEARLSTRENQLIILMSGLQKMAVYPPESVFFAPQNPVDNLRSSLILQSTQKPLKATADKLKVELNKLASLQAAIKAQASQIKLTASRLENERQKMEKLINQKFILQAHFESESQEAKKKATSLGKKARNLEDLLQKLENEKQAKMARLAEAASRQKPILSISTPAAVSGAFAKSLGSLPLPVRGRVVQRYGDTTMGGGSAKGFTMQPRPSAQVIAPFDGTVLFADSFKGYGNLIIIEHSDGYHSLLSGLTRIDCTVGQNVLTGEPVGLMSDKSDNKLYIEFRKDGQPVNPMNWFVSKI